MFKLKSKPIESLAKVPHSYLFRFIAKANRANKASYEEAYEAIVDEGFKEEEFINELNEVYKKSETLISREVSAAVNEINPKGNLEDWELDILIKALGEPD